KPAPPAFITRSLILEGSPPCARSRSSTSRFWRSVSPRCWLKTAARRSSPAIFGATRSWMSACSAMEWAPGGYLTGWSSGLPPDEFVPAVEDSRLVGMFNRHVLEMAIRQARRWERAGMPVPVAVNLTPECLDDPELPDDVQRLLREVGLPPRLLRLEITERAFTALGSSAEQAMERFSASGISVALDDFGVGYSSMARLVRLPVDVLKIDRTFVMPMATDERSAVVVRAAIEIAHSLGLRAVAEGVETERVWRRLRLLGCDWAQGFLISRPVPPDQVLRYFDPTELTPVRRLVAASRRP